MFNNLLSIFAALLLSCLILPMLWIGFVDFIWRIRALFGCGPYADDKSDDDKSEVQK